MTRPGLLRRSSLAAIMKDGDEFSEVFDSGAPPVGLNMAGHDTHLLGPKTVMLDSFVIDLLNVDTGAQTFKLKLLLNMDWEDDGTVVPETKTKRNLRSSAEDVGRRDSNNGSEYKTGKYVLKSEFRDDPISTTWNPDVVLVNAIADESPIEAGSKFHSIQMLSGRPIISRSVLYQPECRCAFSFANFPFDETELVVKFSSNKWNSEEVKFIWSNRFQVKSHLSSDLKKNVDQSAVGGVGLSEFEIIKVRVETDEKEVNCMSKYDNAEGAFSEAYLIIHVRRDPYSYLLRVAAVVELLMLLEVLSFLTHDDDLSARFSISGTIFLAMVSLYGPMADSLPKVSVVTRGDKWHFQNFVLLFASNIENLAACLLRKYISTEHYNLVESFLAIIYLYYVIKNLFWFVSPLKEREDFSKLLIWFESRAALFKGKLHGHISKIRLRWTKKSKDEGEVGAHIRTVRAMAMALKTASKMSHVAQASNGEAGGGGIKDNIITTNNNGKNDMSRFLQQAQNSAIAVPTRNLATIVKPNQEPQLRIKELEGYRLETAARLDSSRTSREGNFEKTPGSDDDKVARLDPSRAAFSSSSEFVKTPGSGDDKAAILDSSRTAFSSISSREGNFEQTSDSNDDNGANSDATSAPSERQRLGRVRAFVDPRAKEKEISPRVQRRYILRRKLAGAARAAQFSLGKTKSLESTDSQKQPGEAKID